MNVHTHLILRGNHAARPAANTLIQGAIYYCTDHKKVYQGNGPANTWSDYTDVFALASDLASYAPLSGGTFAGDISVPDEAYDATAWNGSMEVPTKNAVRDKIEALSVGGSASLTLISSVTTSGSQASVTFSSIAGTYKALVLRVVGRSNISGTDADDLIVQFNGDTGNNYKWARVGSVPASVFAGGSNSTSGAVIGHVTGATSVAGYPGVVDCTIPYYAGTTWKKAGNSLATGMGASDNYQEKIGFNWNNTAAITSIVVKLSGSNTFVNGSVVDLIGVSY